jgi:SAM-dependent methyltransferase
VSERRALSKDFDDPSVRARTGPSLAELWSQEAYELFGPPHDTPHDVASWFNDEGISRVLDIGCGTGAFKRSFDGSWVGLDISIEQLREAGRPSVLGNAGALPFDAAAFEGAVALYVLYFFDDPAAVVAEAHRVLRPGGVFATCAPSRLDCPELHHVLPAEALEETFASEDIPATLETFFENVEINVWDAPMFDLPDHETVRDYLHAHYYPLFTPEEADAAAAKVPTPLKLTKRGAWGVGRRPG